MSADPATRNILRQSPAFKGKDLNQPLKRFAIKCLRDFWRPAPRERNFKSLWKYLKAFCFSLMATRKSDFLPAVFLGSPNPLLHH